MHTPSGFWPRSMEWGWGKGSPRDLHRNWATLLFSTLTTSGKQILLNLPPKRCALFLAKSLLCQPPAVQCWEGQLLKLSYF